MDASGRQFGRTDLFRGTYGGLVLNLLAAACLNNTFWEPSTAAWLITLGVVNELYGVLLVAAPELEPYARRLARWLADVLHSMIHRLWHRVGRLLGLLGPKVVTVGGVASTRAVGSLRASVVRGPPPGASDRDVIWWLVAQIKKAQERLNELEGRLDELPNEWRRDISTIRSELEQVSMQLVREEADRRIELRLIGVGFIVVGIGLTWLGSVITT